MNYRWSWTPGGRELFAAIDEHRFLRCCENPVRLLREASSRELARASRDEELVARAAAQERALAAELARPARVCGSASRERPIAFLCLEYGLHGSLPIYAGGLGGLAGDLLKQASDQALPLVAVGLLYRQGAFHQRLDTSGWQHESWSEVDPHVPAARPRDERAAEPPAVQRSAAWPQGRRPALARRDRPRAALSARRRPTREHPGRPLDRRAAVRRGRRDASRPECAAGNRRRGGSVRAGLRSRHLAPERGCSGARAARARASPDPGRRRIRERARSRAPQHRSHDPYPRRRGQPVLHARRRAQGPRRLARVARPRRRRPARARWSGHRRARRRTARDDAARATGKSFCERREPPTRRGGAGDVAAALARARGGGGAHQPRHQRRSSADVDGRADARAARAPPGRRSRDALRGSRRVGGHRRDPRRGAVGGALPPARAARRVRAPAQRAGSARARRAAGIRRGGCARLRREPAHGGLRASRRDLQAPVPAHPRRRARRAPAGGPPSASAPDRGQGAPARRGGEAHHPVDLPSQAGAAAWRSAWRFSRTTIFRSPPSCARAATSGSICRGRPSRRAGRAA